MSQIAPLTVNLPSDAITELQQEDLSNYCVIWLINYAGLLLLIFRREWNIFGELG
jgi:hypothetical protein